MKVDEEDLLKNVVNIRDAKDRPKEEYMAWLIGLWEQAKPDLKVSGEVIDVDFTAWRAEILAREKER